MEDFWDPTGSQGNYGKQLSTGIEEAAGAKRHIHQSTHKLKSRPQMHEANGTSSDRNSESVREREEAQHYICVASQLYAHAET